MDRKIKHIIAENPFLTLEKIPNYFYCIIKTFLSLVYGCKDTVIWWDGKGRYSKWKVDFSYLVVGICEQWWFFVTLRIKNHNI